MILVSRQPVAVLASPSSSAPALYGFPAGRPFRVIGRDGGFAHIQDLRSSASGWIDEAALALPPRMPAVSPQSVESLQIPPPIQSQKRARRTSGSLPTLRQPLKGTPSKRASAPAYWPRGRLWGHLPQ